MEISVAQYSNLILFKQDCTLSAALSIQNLSPQKHLFRYKIAFWSMVPVLEQASVRSTSCKVTYKVIIPNILNYTWNGTDLLSTSPSSSPKMSCFSDLDLTLPCMQHLQMQWLPRYQQHHQDTNSITWCHRT